MTAAIGKSIETFRAEAKKCVLVCANCHGEIEAGLVISPEPGATYADMHDCWDEPGFEQLLLGRNDEALA